MSRLESPALLKLGVSLDVFERVDINLNFGLSSIMHSKMTGYQDREVAQAAVARKQVQKAI